MPVILTTSDEIETWLTTPSEEARKLQRPLPLGMLRVNTVTHRGTRALSPADDVAGLSLRGR
jgi:putative SOS response-associated peptidase YedK